MRHIDALQPITQYVNLNADKPCPRLATLSELRQHFARNGRPTPMPPETTNPLRATMVEVFRLPKPPRKKRRPTEFEIPVRQAIASLVRKSGRASLNAVATVTGFSKRTVQKTTAWKKHRRELKKALPGSRVRQLTEGHMIGLTSSNLARRQALALLIDEQRADDDDFAGRNRRKSA